MTIPETLAEDFARSIKFCFTPDEWAETRRRNALPEYAGDVCATHDFCDANMIMAASFERVVGRPMVMEGGDSPEEQADHALWNAAWDIAKEKYLTEKGTS